MLVVVILANGLLQNIVQPIAFGATLDLNPLVVLIVTIGVGSLFGMLGMVLAAPLTSAALHISRELAAAKAAEAAASGRGRRAPARRRSERDSGSLHGDADGERRDPEHASRRRGDSRARAGPNRVDGSVELGAHAGEEERDGEEDDCEDVVGSSLDVLPDGRRTRLGPRRPGARASSSAASLYSGIANGLSGASGFFKRLRCDPGVDGGLNSGRNRLK